MGDIEQRKGEQGNGESSSVYPTMVCASNTGRCVEDSYPAGAVLVNLGSGSITWKGWINCDLSNEHADILCDVRKLTFPDNYADAICGIHIIEHLYFWDVNDALKEWLRALKPQGKLILECPSMDKVFAYILSHVKSGKMLSPTYSWFALWGDPKYRTIDQVHKWGYNPQMLGDLMRHAGFVNVSSQKARYHFPARDMRMEGFKP